MAQCCCKTHGENLQTFSKYWCRINNPAVAWEYERNIQSISQCCSAFETLIGDRFGDLYPFQDQNWKKLIWIKKLRNCILYYHTKFQNTGINNKEFFNFAEAPLNNFSYVFSNYDFLVSYIYMRYERCQVLVDLIELPAFQPQLCICLRHE